jgi:tricorn protease interacting factor F2/3
MSHVPEKITYLIRLFAAQLAACAMEVSHYDLFIDLDFQNLYYNGTLRVKLSAEQNVVLDAVGVNIKRVSSGAQNFRFNQTKDNLTIETGPFDGVLQVEFAGSIPDSLAGIYRAPYENTYIITTHFEAAQARRMFPCVDRPDFKAEFKLAVRVDNDLEAISNMPIESQEPDGDKKIVTFQKTPRMSTYLLYLGVGKFQAQRSKLGDTEIILATTPGKTSQVAFAQDEARKSIEFFNSYYKIPYALPKIHLIAVPEFAMGAMENWGAITFREILLLVDANTSARSKLRIAMVIAHELAHQWFGDLVTMKWWNDIWLNESFATFMAYKAVDSAHPDWRIWTNFFNGEPRVETLAGAMGRDFLKNTHPIQAQVKSPEEIEQVFDAISYGKGAHVLHMIEAYIGEGAFREGVSRYLSAHAYSNATGDDLWSTLEEASGKPVKKIMSSWIRQEGFPVLTVSKHNGKLTLRQERLLISGDSAKVTWPIPLTVEVNDERTSVLMDAAEEHIEVDGLERLRVNPDRTGFYAIQYEGIDDIVWGSSPSSYDRWGIIFDAFSFLLAGRISFNEYLAVVKRLENESDTLPAQELSDQLELFRSLFPSRVLETSRRVHRALLGKLESRTDEESLMLRGRIASRLALVDSGYATRLARDFKGYVKVPPDMRLAVATAYARSTNDIEGLLRAYRASSSDEDRVKFLEAMTTFAGQALVKRTLDFAISGEVKRQDVIGVVGGAAANHQAKPMVWDWLQLNIGKLQELYHSTGILSGAFLSIIPVLCVGRVQEAEGFFAKHMIPDAEMGIKAGLEKLNAYDRLVRTTMTQ